MVKEGLTNLEAKKRLKKFGRNELEKRGKANPTKIFISQFKSPLIIILVVAALVSFSVGFLPNQDPHTIDTVLILVIVLASGISGFMQDYKAEKTIEALQKIATPKSKVIRDGIELKIDITEIVPGDLVILEEGDVIPADCRIIQLFNMEVDESTLSGESSAVSKKLNDEVFKGTFVSSGNAQALVLKTGMKTKIGQIADKLQDIKDERTSFQEEISKISKKTIYVISGIIAIIFIIALIKYNIYRSLLMSISLAVAAIPEGLPAVLVLVLAIGGKVMASKNALVRKLNVVESIGAVDIICTDKTGTLTKNEMEVTKIFSENQTFDLKNISKQDVEKIKQILLIGKLCNNSKISYNENKEKMYFGDQTEIALKKVSERFLKDEKGFEKIQEISFDSKRKMMTSVYKKGSKVYLFSKGAPEVLVSKCNKIYINGKVRAIRPSERKEILKKNNEFASQALRVLGFAFRETSEKDYRESDLVWVGLQAMIDPPRKEVAQAIKDCSTAGIRVIMVTGDNPQTAKAIGKEIGLDNKFVITGDQIEKMSDSDLKKKLKEVSIFARTSPFHKLRILKILKKESRVAMTGDGVNDALALKKADVGISMGIRGTDVAKQASDIILLDDNFVTIVDAVREGRRSFDNIRKFINYLFVCNLAEVGVLFFATLFLTLKEPILLPIQILWINLLTDGMPALALGLDPARPNIMNERPRKKNEPIINRQLAWIIGIIGFKKILILLATFFIIRMIGGIEQARTALFTGFILYEFVRIGSIRSQEKLGWWDNKWLLLALGISLILQFIVVYTPLKNLFHIAPLGLYAWVVLTIGVLIAYFVAIWVTKIIVKRIPN
ncbi:MAG: cation-translocating P-type ATPase [Nanoarchaeota archaeon]|nr:cation-translocating P-type ATPase [Nanoarchaeota archaeon]